MDAFKDKILLITGGTGSFGNAVCSKFLQGTQIKEIRIFSRDEKKQDDMRKRFASPKLKFYLGDVRDINSIYAAIYDVDYIFHAAALKQVPSCEFHPLEAMKTNVMGTQNLLDAAVDAGVKRVVCLSTDKAVYPINAMGMSKALMEKVVVAKSRQIATTKTLICATRYGNVMASRGSVIPLFISQIKQKKPISVTAHDMTRFMMSLDEAVGLVLYAFQNANSGDIYVQKSPAATIQVIATAIKELMGKPNHPIECIGVRHGEKMHETLLTREERSNAIDAGRYYCVPTDSRDLNYGAYYEAGEKGLEDVEEYNSENTNRLDLQALKNVLMSLDELDFGASQLLRESICT